MDVLFRGVGWTDIALTLNRIAVGMFFMFSATTSYSTRSAIVHSSTS